MSNTCAFDTLAQIILTGLYTWEDSGEGVSRLAVENRFFSFISSIVTSEEVSGTTYLERLAILQPLRPYRGALEIINGDNGPSHANFDATVNLPGLVPYILQGTAPSIMLQVDACPRGHLAKPHPVKTITFTAQKLLEDPVSMINIVPDTVLGLTSDSAIIDCDIAHCPVQRRRSYLETGG